MSFDLGLYSVPGKPTPPSEIFVYSNANGYSSGGFIRRYAVIGKNVGNDIQFIDGADSGTLFRINTSGIYSMTACDRDNAARDWGIVVDPAVPEQRFDSNVAIEILASGSNTAGQEGCVSVVTYLNAGQVVRVQSGPTSPAGNVTITSFRIIKL